MTFDSPKPKLKRPKLGRIDLRDFLHGLFIAFIGGTVTAFVDGLNLAINNKNTLDVFTIEHMQIHLMVGLQAAISYILKKFLTNSNGKILKRD
jgi:hypothetical protein